MIPFLRRHLARLILASTPPHRRLAELAGDGWQARLLVDPTALYVGASWQAVPVGYQTDASLVLSVALLPGLVLRVDIESSYERWIRAAEVECRCCPCCRPEPCAGVLYGGLCDRMACKREGEPGDLPF